MADKKFEPQASVGIKDANIESKCGWSPFNEYKLKGSPVATIISGKIKMRARAHIETNKKGRNSIVVTEVPYQTNKANLVEKIADLVKDKRIEGISDLRDESDKDGIRVVIETKRDAVPEVILNQLFKHTLSYINLLSTLSNSS